MAVQRSDLGAGQPVSDWSAKSGSAGICPTTHRWAEKVCGTVSVLAASGGHMAFRPRAVERNARQAAQPLPGSRVPDDLRPAIQAAVFGGGGGSRGIQPSAASSSCHANEGTSPWTPFDLSGGDRLP